METYLDLFLEYITVERGLTANTRASYSSDLLKFLDYLNERGINEWGQVRFSDVMSFLSQAAEQNLAPRSRARLLATLRGFFGFMVRDSHLDQSPVANLTSPRLRRRLPDVLSISEVELLLAQVELTRHRGEYAKSLGLCQQALKLGREIDEPAVTHWAARQDPQP